MASISSNWYGFPFEDEAIETISKLSYQHMIILWVDVLSDYPDMTNEELNDYFANEREDIARRLSRESWDEIVAENWEEKPTGAIHELIAHWKWLERINRE